MNHLSTFCEVQKALDYASGSASRNGAIVDTAHWESIAAVVKFEAIAAGTTLTVKLQQGDASDLSDAADVTGASFTVADTADLEIRILDLQSPAKRYVRVVVTKGVSTSAEAALYLLYGPKLVVPANNVATLIATTKLIANQGAVS